MIPDAPIIEEAADTIDKGKKKKKKVTKSNK